jgi:hypothetical protein
VRAGPAGEAGLQHAAKEERLGERRGQQQQQRECERQQVREAARLDQLPDRETALRHEHLQHAEGDPAVAAQARPVARLPGPVVRTGLELSRFRGRVDAFDSSGLQGRFLVVHG